MYDVSRMRSPALAAFAGLALACAPLLAHHSFAAEYDSTKPVELKGTVTSLEWVNPHAWIHMDVAGPDGKTVSWNCELGSPNLLLRNGWRRDTLKAGDTITVNGSMAKDGAHIANAKTVKTGDGKRVFNAGSSGDPGTPGAPQQ
jgi:Family of unknown function (DUF6152)